MLIVTNDGELAEQMAHPRYEVPRVYRVQVAGVPTPQTLSELRKGIHFTEGKFGLKRTKRLKTHGNSTFLEVELARPESGNPPFVRSSWSQGDVASTHRIRAAQAR